MVAEEHAPNPSQGMGGLTSRQTLGREGGVFWGACMPRWAQQGAEPRRRLGWLSGNCVPYRIALPSTGTLGVGRGAGTLVSPDTGVCGQDVPRGLELCMGLEAGHGPECASWYRMQTQVPGAWDAPVWKCSPFPYQDPRAAMDTVTSHPRNPKQPRNQPHGRHHTRLPGPSLHLHPPQAPRPLSPA